MSNKIQEYVKDNKLDLDKIVDDFKPYIRQIIINMSDEILSQEDIEEIMLDTFFVLWKNYNLRKKY